MPQTIEAFRRPPRVKLSQPMRVRPYNSQLPEEICVTQNVSRKGFYFETSLGHYRPGMYVRVTRNFHAGDPVSREDEGDVVRVEKLKTGKWGVAIRIQPGADRPQTSQAAPAKTVEAGAGVTDHRRTHRARVKIPLFVYGSTPKDEPFVEETCTLEINAHGALIAMKTPVSAGERLLLTNETNEKSQECTVLAVRARRGRDAECAVAVKFGAAAPAFWRKTEAQDHPSNAPKPDRLVLNAV
jgi:hypothetical protein